MPIVSDLCRPQMPGIKVEFSYNNRCLHCVVDPGKTNLQERASEFKFDNRTVEQIVGRTLCGARPAGRAGGRWRFVGSSRNQFVTARSANAEFVT